jgi:hypothetical protein
MLLGNHLKALKLPTFAREYEKVARESAQDRADYPRYLLRLCELERIDRERRNVERRIRLARFPQTKSLDTFDFTAQPSLNKALVLEPARLANGSRSAITALRSGRRRLSGGRTRRERRAYFVRNRGSAQYQPDDRAAHDREWRASCATAL